MGKKTILFELNEVPLRIVDDHVRRRPESALARLLDRSFVAETVCEDVGALSPWCTWPSLHRGVSNERHGIAHFGQPLEDVDREHPPAWRLLAQAGIATGVFGSLHSWPPPPRPEGYAFYVPDTFAAGSECFPAELEAFQEFNLQTARASARNVGSGLPWGSALRFLAAAPFLGLKAGTALRLGAQVGAERVQPWRRTRRRTFQAVLAFDLFVEQVLRAEPDFATFFTNHVAAAMHRYWAAAHPGDYDDFGYDEAWVRTYGDEIAFAMDHADRMVARLACLVGSRPGWQLLVATSMGQAATTARPVDSQLYVADLPRLMAALGVPEGEWSRRPAMAPQVNLVTTPGRTAAFRAALATVAVEGRPIHFDERDGGFFSITLGQADLHRGPQLARVGEREVPFAELGLECTHVEDLTGTSAYHVPEGTLVLYDPSSPRRRQARPQVSTLDVVPWLLRNFAVPVPSYMSGAASLG